jgi:predicted metal-binding protein
MNDIGSNISFEKLNTLALEAGFDAAGALDCSTIDLHPEVRAACKTDRCGRYGTNWSCPPGCGTLEECAVRIRQYAKGLIVQTIGVLEDEFDGEGMMAAADRHTQSFLRLAGQLRADFPAMLPMGTGSCSICDTCTYPDAPCRSPEGATAPMEAFGMIVSDICKKNDLLYYHGKGTITYVGCFLLI